MPVMYCELIFPAMEKNPQTLSLITDEHLRLIKSSAMVVDIAHGFFNREKTIEMVENKILFGYGFEGLPNEFNKLKGNVWVAPAYAWTTYESMHGSMVKWIDNMISASKNEFPNRVNKSNNDIK